MSLLTSKSIEFCIILSKHQLDQTRGSGKALGQIWPETSRWLKKYNLFKNLETSTTLEEEALPTFIVNMGRF